jgi:oligopeptide/dipeptide ABC transporter ATP-binding protein
VALLARVGVPDAAARVHDNPHHFSGGMRQRVLIAMAIACNPDIIIADEPTTALDVTVQAKILRLLHDLQQAMGASLLMITHDLGVVAALADTVVVMYAGRVVERADVDTLFHAPLHPYTRALLDCAISLDDDRETPLEPIAGAPPDLRQRPPGCQFAPRCPVAVAICRSSDPPLLAMSPSQDVACFVAQGTAHG